MTIKELLEQLKKLGIKNPAIPERTIKRWAFTEGIISKPTPAELKGPGQTADWPDEALEEAAAIWAVRHNERGVRIKADMAEIIKDLALSVWTGWAVYSATPVCQSPPEGVPRIDTQPQFASEGITRSVGSEVISLFPGRDKKDKVSFLDDLTIKWIATVVKVRYAREQGKSCHLNQRAVVVLRYRRALQKERRYQDGRLMLLIGYVQLHQVLIGAESDRGDRVIIFENDVYPHILLERDINIRAYDYAPPTLDNVMQSIRRQPPYDRIMESIRRQPPYDRIMESIRRASIGSRKANDGPEEAKTGATRKA